MSRQPSSGPGDVNVVGGRIAAQLLDYAVMFLLLIVVVFVGAAAAGSQGGAEATVFFGLLAVGLGYGTVLEGAYGKTVGKMVTGIRVVDRRGTDIGYGKALVRNIPALFGGWLTWLVGMAAIAIDDQNQRLFDGVAGTYVVRDTGRKSGSGDGRR
ncbi:RDD family protein [Halolamina sp. C58]|uniref:RDD family protein n=1 Tax=Halolamina sp. C58 TaxID=3421640 RepID=UPI003EB8AAD8